MTISSIRRGNARRQTWQRPEYHLFSGPGPSFPGFRRHVQLIEASALPWRSPLPGGWWRLFQRVRPADSRNGQDPLLHRLFGDGVLKQRGQGVRADGDPYPLASLVLGGHAGDYRSAKAGPEGELHRGVGRAGRAVVGAGPDRVEAVDDRGDPGHRGRIGDGERVVELLLAAEIELLAAESGFLPASGMRKGGRWTHAEHRGHGHHVGVGRHPLGGSAGGQPDGQPGRDTSQGGEEVHDTAAAGPGGRGDIHHGSGTAPPAAGFRWLRNRYLATVINTGLRLRAYSFLCCQDATPSKPCPLGE
jgi:hypothetical protein